MWLKRKLSSARCRLRKTAMPTNVNTSADAQRKRRVCANYGQNAAGKWVRKKAWRECDYTDGHLREFDTEGDFLAFEEERRVQGHCQAHYEKKPRSTVPKEQLALEEAIANAVAADGNETRVQLQNVEEGLHERLDKQEADLREIRAHQKRESEDQKAILEKKAKLADKQKARNEAFAKRVEAGDDTPLEKKKLRLKILAEEVRREEAEASLEKQREKARKQSEKERKQNEKERKQKAPKQSEKAKKRPHEENQEHGDLKKKEWRI